jgi:glucose/arabinose dehydrogenase
MFQTEHGPSGFDGPNGGDEFNFVEKGKNYGWPVIHHTQTQEGLVSPCSNTHLHVHPRAARFIEARYFRNSKATSSLDVCEGERIIRVVLDKQRVVSQEDLLAGKYGRIRDVAEGPDGFIYFSTSNRDGRGTPAADDDRIMRLMPLK